MRRFKRPGDVWLVLAVALLIAAHDAPARQADAQARGGRGAEANLARRPPAGRGGAGARLDEEFAFSLPDFKMNHQGEVNTLDIGVSYLYVPGIRDADYPDFRLLFKDVEGFLEGYPNEGDYWEVVNKKMAGMLLTRYPTLSRVRIEMSVSPSKLEPYHRSSTVTLSRGARRAERTGAAGGAVFKGTLSRRRGRSGSGTAASP